MENECCRCCFFEAYYTKAYYKYLRTDCGYCRNANKFGIKQKHTSACEYFKARGTSLKMRTSILLDGLKDILTDVNIIKEFITEYTEDPKNK